MELFTGTLNGIIGTSGFALMDIRSLIMIFLSCVLLYLGIVKKFEPLLLVGIAFGMLLTNLPGSEIYHTEMWITNSINHCATVVCWIFCTSASRPACTPP